MAKKTRARRSAASGKVSTIKKSLRDAQTVFARYFESGGKRVKETFDALAEIFEKRHLSNALRVSAVGARSGGRRRAGAARSKSARSASPRVTGTRTTARKRSTRRKTS
jgi:hypothetical protein